MASDAAKKSVLNQIKMKFILVALLAVNIIVAVMGKNLMHFSKCYNFY